MVNTYWEIEDLRCYVLNNASEKTTELFHNKMDMDYYWPIDDVIGEDGGICEFIMQELFLELDKYKQL